MKTNKIIKIITVVLLIAIITIASIFGIYKLKDYKVRDVVPDYLLGMEFTERRVIDLAVDTTAEKTIYDKDGNYIRRNAFEYLRDYVGYRISAESLKVSVDDEIKLSLKDGSTLIALGDGLKIVAFDEKNGNFTAHGNISSIKFSGSGKNFIKKVFK